MDIVLLNDLAQVPTRGTSYAAGYDLYAATEHEVTIAPHTTETIGTGIAIALPSDTFGAVFARSGLATKEGLRLANGTAVIDADYRGEVIVPIYNDSSIPKTINPGERIAQLVVIPFDPVELNVVDELDITRRGTGGFGSTGV